MIPYFFQSRMLFKTPGEERNLGRGPVTHNAVCLIHDDLESDTIYSFSVRAFNAAGESEVSETIECSTLQESRTGLRGKGALCLFPSKMERF